MSGIEGVQEFLVRLMASKVSDVEGFKSFQKILGRRGTKIEGAQANYEVSRSPSSLTTP